MFAYVGKDAAGKYQPFAFKRSVSQSDVEVSEDMYIVRAIDLPTTPEPLPVPPSPETPMPSPSPSPRPQPQPGPQPTLSDKVSGIEWAGEVTPQKWMNFYTRVVSRFVSGPGLKITVQVAVRPTDGISRSSIEETKNALRELGLNDNIDSE